MGCLYLENDYSSSHLLFHECLIPTGLFHGFLVTVTITTGLFASRIISTHSCTIFSRRFRKQHTFLSKSRPTRIDQLVVSGLSSWTTFLWHNLVAHQILFLELSFMWLVSSSPTIPLTHTTSLTWSTWSRNLILFGLTSMRFSLSFTLSNQPQGPDQHRYSGVQGVRLFLNLNKVISSFTSWSMVLKKTTKSLNRFISES